MWDGQRNSPRGIMAMKLQIKTAVSEIESFPPAFTKCNAHPIGTNTNKTFLPISSFSPWVLSSLQPTRHCRSFKTTKQCRCFSNLPFRSQQSRSHPPQCLWYWPIGSSGFTSILSSLGFRPRSWDCTSFIESYSSFRSRRARSRWDFMDIGCCSRWWSQRCFLINSKPISYGGGLTWHAVWLLSWLEIQEICTSEHRRSM